MFKSFGHFFATLYTTTVAGLKKVEATATTVEAVTEANAGPVYGPLALTVEKAGYAVLGELSAVLTTGGTAVEQKLKDAGLDDAVIATVKALIGGIATLKASV